MARVDLTKTTAPGYYAAAGQAVTMADADIAEDGNQFTATGNDLVIAHNTGATPHNITINSVADPYNRSGDITSESIAAGAIKIFGPYKTLGWQQSDGKIYLSADSDEVEFGVVALPG